MNSVVIYNSTTKALSLESLDTFAKLNNIPINNNQLSNGAGYLVSIDSTQIINALGYTPINPNGNSTQYITGNGSKVTFPVIPSPQIQVDWLQTNTGLLDYIKNKPIISNIIVNNTTVGLSKSYLNTTYPNVNLGQLICCPNILLGGAIYIKVIENGNNDTWQAISAPPSL